MYVMPSSKFVNVLLAASFAVATVTAQQSVVFGDLKLTDEGGCNCIPLSECPSLLPPSGSRLTPQMRLIIREKKCGYVNQSVRLKVCCPKIIPTTEAPPPSPIPTELPLTCGLNTNFAKIFGGEIAGLGEFPWAVAIGYKGVTLGDFSNELDFLCGGSLVTTQHVITAAHCVHPSQIFASTVDQLNIGEWELTTDPDCTTQQYTGKRICAPAVIKRRAAKITWHPDYNSNGNHNMDVAIIRLDRPVTFGAYVQPVCIPNTFTKHHPLATAVGWGKTESVTGVTTVLQKVKLPFVDMVTCNETWGGKLNDYQLCAGGEEGKDSCRGDSGGPLITSGPKGPPYMLVGLTSFGSTSRCGTENRYGVYTALDKLRGWIVDNLAN